MTIDRMKLDHVFVFNTLAEPIEIRVREIGFGRDVTARLELAFPIYQRCLAEGLFHLDDETKPVGFQPDLTVEIGLRLRTVPARPFEDAEAVLQSLAIPDSPTRNTEAWFATTIMQNAPLPDGMEGYADFGVRTQWARPISEEMF